MLRAAGTGRRDYHYHRGMRDSNPIASFGVGWLAGDGVVVHGPWSAQQYVQWTNEPEGRPLARTGPAQKDKKDHSDESRIPGAQNRGCSDLRAGRGGSLSREESHLAYTITYTHRGPAKRYHHRWSDITDDRWLMPA
ncbi:hypothetical protein C8R45DRAFT_927077 [Mycena sanguinolenta]|nr:hypothetical protein C8R45DRAFT_927077 [Mycena sanguinolenta]